MDRLQAATAALVIIAIAAIAAAFLLARPPSPPSLPTPDLSPDQSALQLASERLAGSRLSIATPASSVWPPGTTASLALGLKAESAATYVLSFSLESVAGKLSGQPLPAGTSSWFHFEPAHALAAGATKTVPVLATVPADAAEGIYVFRISVCAGEPCAPYASLQLPIEVREGAQA